MKRSLAAVAILSLAGFASATAALAGWRSRDYGEPDFAVAESRHGNGTVSGPVRAGRTGYEVRLPGGTWVACRTNCRETLRVETVDFWENQGGLAGAGAIQNECGIFGCLEVRYPR
jgi:hypothetical protein